MYKVSIYRHDTKGLPRDIQAALIGTGESAKLYRLTADLFWLRIGYTDPTVYIGTLEELQPLLADMPVKKPYVPPQPRELEDDPLASLSLNISLDI